MMHLLGFLASFLIIFGCSTNRDSSDVKNNDQQPTLQSNSVRANEIFEPKVKKRASKILGVSEKASTNDINRAFRKKARSIHPDKCKTEDCKKAFLKLGASRDALLNGDIDSLCSLEHDLCTIEVGVEDTDSDMHDHSHATKDSKKEEPPKGPSFYSVNKCDVEYCIKCQHANASKCILCAYGWVDHEDGSCVKCDAGCFNCKRKHEKVFCEECLYGYYYSSDFSRCIPRGECNIQNCYVCGSETSCRYCKNGYEGTDYYVHPDTGHKYARQCIKK